MFSLIKQLFTYVEKSTGTIAGYGRGGGAQNPRVVCEHERDMSKENIWCGLTRNSYHWTILLHGDYNHRKCVFEHVAELCC